jgi:predicted metal-binding protein
MTTTPTACSPSCSRDERERRHSDDRPVPHPAPMNHGGNVSEEPADVSAEALLALAPDLTPWTGRALELGCDRARVIDPATVEVAQWVRMKCLYGCDEPGVYRTCPPDGAPALEETRRLLGEYRRALLLGVGPIVGDRRSDAESRRLNDAAIALERELFLAGFHKAWTMGAGPCDICSACTKGEPCPTPELARPSMEGCCIDVFTTVRRAGWEIEVVKDRSDEFRFFALVLVD